MIVFYNNFLRVRPRSSGEHCLNGNTGVCGKSPSHNYETSAWLDRNGDPMPWIAQGIYHEGGTMKVDSYLDTHHNGHMGELFTLVSHTTFSVDTNSKYTISTYNLYL